MQQVFEAVWEKYPKKLGKKQAYKHFKSSVRNQQDYSKFEMALNNYLNHLEKKDIEFEYIMHGKTFFYNWEDWVSYVEPQSKEDRSREIKQRIFRDS